MASVSSTLSIARSRQHRSSSALATAGYFGAFVGLGLSTGLLGPTLPTLAQQTGVSLGAISYLFTARSSGYILGSLRFGSFFDGRSGNRLMGLMLIGMSLTNALVTQAGSLWILLLLMLVLGAAEGSLDVGANTLMVHVHGRSVGPYMTALHSCFGIGALVAPLILAQVTVSGRSAVTSYFVIALMLLPIAAFLFRVKRAGLSLTVDEEIVTNSSRRVVPLFALFLFLYVGAEVGFAGWIFSYVTESRLGNATAAAFITSLFWAALTVGRIVGIPFAARITPARFLKLSLSAALASLSLIVATNSLLLLVIATSAFGLSMASIFPSTMTLASQRMRVSGQLTGWFVTGASLGAMTVPLVIGQFFRLVGPYAVIAGTGSALIMAIVVLRYISQYREVHCFTN